MRLSLALILGLLVVGGGAFYALNNFVEVVENDSEESEVSSLPYAAWVPAKAEKKGVTIYRQGQTFDGLSVYNSTNSPQAVLIDMHGKQIHRWVPPLKNTWQHIHLYPDGSILAVSKDKYLAKIAWDSSVVWKLDGRYHHDVSVDSKGKIYSLRRKEKVIKRGQDIFPILDDVIDVISADGKILATTSIYDLVADKVYQKSFDAALKVANNKDITGLALNAKYSGPRLGEDSKFDILHTNAVFPLEHKVPGVSEVGDVIISPRNIDLIAIVDLKNKKLRWSWGQGELARQHHPTLLENGNILIFDNQPKKKKSRVVELDPKTKTIVWQAGNGKPRFFSSSRGAAQRLPNGNTLITESDKGRVIEVTKDFEIVWEYFHPETKTDKKGRVGRQAFYRVNRINSDYLEVKPKA